MKIKITKDEITKAIRRIERGVRKKNQLPVLGSALMTANDGRATFTVTDLEMVIKTTVAADIIEGGSVCIPVALAADLVKEFPEGVISMETSGRRMKIEAGNASFILNIYPEEEFPAVEEPPTGDVFMMPAGELDRMLRQVLFAVSMDDANPALCSVLFKGNGEKVQMVATDGRRLAGSGGSVKGFTGKALILSRTAHEIARFAADVEGDLSVNVTEKFIRIAAGDTVLSARLTEGDFPEYQEIVRISSGDHGKKLTVNPDALMSALKRVTVVSEKGIRLSVSGSSILLKGKAEIGEAVDEVDVSYSGLPVTVGFNGQYLQEGLSVLSGNVVFNFGKDGYSPVLISAEGDCSALQLLMPMRLSDDMEAAGAVNEPLKEAA